MILFYADQHLQNFDANRRNVCDGKRCCYGQQDDQTGCDADCARQYALHSAPARIFAFFLLLLGELALKQQVGVSGDFFLFWSMLKLAFGNQLINFRIFLRLAGQSDHKFQMLVHQILIILHGFTFPP